MVLAELDDRTSRQLALDQVAAANAPSLSQPALDRLISLSGGNPFHLEELVTFLLGTRHRSEPRPPLRHGPADQPAQPAAGPHRRAARVAAAHPQGRQRGRHPVLDRGRGRFLPRARQRARGRPSAADPGPSRADRAGAGRGRLRLPQHHHPAGRVRDIAVRPTLRPARPGAVLVRGQRRGQCGAPALDLLAFHAAHGTDVEKKRDYVVRAGFAAQARYANDAAVDYFSQAIPVVPETERGGLLLRLGKVLEILGRWDEADASYQRAVDLYSQQDDRQGWANAQADRAEVARKQGRFAAARELLLQANQVFTELDDRAGLANVLHLLGTLASQQSQFDEARASYGASLQIRPRARRPAQGRRAAQQPRRRGGAARRVRRRPAAQRAGPGACGRPSATRGRCPCRTTTSG